MRKSADRQRKRQSRAAAPKHPADPPRDLESEPPRWSPNNHTLVLPRSTVCSGSTLDRPYSNCNDGATSTHVHTALVCGTACGGSKQIPSSGSPTIRELSRFASIWNSKLRLALMDSSRVPLKLDERGPGDAPAKSHGKLALALGVIAIALSLGLGIVSLRSV